MDSLISTLLHRSEPSKLAFIADIEGQRTKMKMDHLACFVPGMLALGAFYSDGTPLAAKKWEHMKTAKALMYTCWQYYDRTPTGLSPEFMDFAGGRDPVPARKVGLFRFCLNAMQTDVDGGGACACFLCRRCFTYYDQKLPNPCSCCIS
jgi:hypothetical protein